MIALGPLDTAPRGIRPPFDQHPDDGHRAGVTGEAWRARRQQDREAALRDALAGIELGEFDGHAVEYFAGLDTPELGTIVSWLLRVRAAGAPQSSASSTTVVTNSDSDSTA